MVDCLNCRYMEVHQTITQNGRHKIYGDKKFLCTNGKSEYVMLFREEGDICDEWEHKNFLIRFLDKHFGERRYLMTEIDNEELFYWIIMFSFVAMMWITVLWAWL